MSGRGTWNRPSSEFQHISLRMPDLSYSILCIRPPTVQLSAAIGTSRRRSADLRLSSLLCLRRLEEGFELMSLFS